MTDRERITKVIREWQGSEEAGKDVLYRHSTQKLAEMLVGMIDEIRREIKDASRTDERSPTT
jgi:hypothetical protein